MDLSTFGPIAQLGAAGVLLGVVYWLIRMIARGDWVPRRELDYVRQDRDARLAEKDREIAEWRAATATERAARDVVSDQNRELITGFRTLDHFYEAFRANATAGTPPEGDRHDRT